MSDNTKKSTPPHQGSDIDAGNLPFEDKLTIDFSKSKRKIMSPGKLSYKGFAGVYAQGKNTSLKRKRN